MLKNRSNELLLLENSKKLSESSTVTGSSLHFTPQVVKFPNANLVDKINSHISTQELERQPELKYVFILKFQLI